MKTIATLIFVLFIGMSAQGQKVNEEVKVLILTEGIEKYNSQEVVVSSYNSVTRLYKFKNSTIKRALSFSTKLNKARLA
ncbi:hypothetical protein KCTC52924_02493 [Arenibacter antarcticus]|uniref:Uncharacterized protein n=1 Tax=Arenibacter antarcticus TaxID=2040469 RepID=A0ABW5VN54_9FLAO|nr:hypothetical protein [Arenibacter sp. H213]MCM4168800.1 hypothetical protein [Arenibacter sp. H213]